MSEFFSQRHSSEFEQGEVVIDRPETIDRMQSLGIDVELSDIDDLDDEGLIGAIRTYANMFDLDEDDVLKYVLDEELEKIREFDDEI